MAAAQNPKPQTLALTSEDAEFARNACEGARENAKKYGFKIIYDKTFPPGTTDFSPIIHALQAANADLVVVCSYPLSSVGIVQSAKELGLNPKMLGGAMVGLQATVFKDRLKSKLNGIVNYETWVPSPKLMAPAAAFFKIYQERAKAAGVDPLGYYLGGWGYADFQLIGEAIEGAKTLNDDKLANYLRSHEFKTIMGDIKFGPGGEWTKSGMLQVQYHGITDAANPETWRGMSYQNVLTPDDQKTGSVIYPYDKRYQTVLTPEDQKSSNIIPYDNGGTSTPTSSIFVDYLGYLIRFNNILTVVCIVLLISLAPFRKTRIVPAYGLYVASFVFGVCVWMYGFAVTYQIWGGVGIFIGLILGIVGVVPLGIIAASWHSEWAIVAELIYGLVLTYGARAIALWLWTKIEADANRPANVQRASAADADADNGPMEWQTFLEHDSDVSKAVERLSWISPRNVEEFRTLLLQSHDRNRVKEFEEEAIRRIQGLAFAGDTTLLQAYISLNREDGRLSDEFVSSGRHWKTRRFGTDGRSDSKKSPSQRENRTGPSRSHRVCDTIITCAAGGTAENFQGHWKAVEPEN